MHFGKREQRFRLAFRSVAHGPSPGRQRGKEWRERPYDSGRTAKERHAWPRRLQTPDSRKTFEELRAKGEEFVSGPKDQFYGVEAVFKDPFGNWFSMAQPMNY